MYVYTVYMSQSIETLRDLLERTFLICLVVDFAVLLFAFTVLASLGSRIKPVLLPEEVERLSLDITRSVIGVALVSDLARFVSAGALLHMGLQLRRCGPRYRLLAIAGPGLLLVALVLGVAVLTALHVVASRVNTVHELAHVIIRLYPGLTATGVVSLVSFLLIGILIYFVGKELNRDLVKIGGVLLMVAAAISPFASLIATVIRIVAWLLCAWGVKH